MTDPFPIAAPGSANLEAMAATLEASGAYRVLRRLAPRPTIVPPPGVELRWGLFVDVETTGLDPARDEIIELAMVPFSYGPDSKVYGISEPFTQLRQPNKPIPAEITAITGLTDTMVAGHIIDPAAVTAFVAPATVIIAHNAAFDRRFLERFCQTFTTKPWACSMSQVDWQAAGFEGTKLGYLAAAAGFFYDRHRAVHDCLAAVELLAGRHHPNGQTGLYHLLEAARTPTWRIWAEHAAFELKDHLKARGYRWNAEAIGGPKAWYVDVLEAQRDAELNFLKTEIYRRDYTPLMRRIDAYDRFSERC